MKRYPQKSIRTAYILWLVSGFGWLGLHRIYLDKHRTCLVWTLTFGLMGVGALIDLFILHRLVQRYNIIQQRRALLHQRRLLVKKKAKLETEQRFEEAAQFQHQEAEVLLQLKSLQGALQSKPVWPIDTKTVEAN
jgi:TM2 domain-containing membrane protein YozV